MMTRINLYLTFNGNCREAMMFYQECLGGELEFQTIGESPMSDALPQQMKDCILHAMLSNDGMMLMGSDMVPQSGLHKGNAVALSLNCTSEDEARELYARLSNGGSTDHPLEDTHWGALFGELTDRYGHHWLVHFDRN